MGRERAICFAVREVEMTRVKGIFSILILVLGDMVAIVLSFLLGYLVRAIFSDGGLAGGVAAETLINRIYFLVVYPFVFVYEGLYTKRLTIWEERRRCFRGVLVASAILTILLFMVRLWIVSRFVVLLATVFATVLVPVVRTGIKRLLVEVGLFLQPVVIVGDKTGSETFSRQLHLNRTLGYIVVKHIQKNNPDDDIIALLQGAEIPAGSLLVVLTESFTPQELRAIFNYSEQRFAELMVVPDANFLAASAAEIEQVGSLLVLKYRYNLLRPVNIWTKRIFEFALSLILTVLFLPLFAILSLVIKLSSPGPVFFRQERIGYKGRVFNCFKFRTMYQDAEKRLKEILENNPEAREEWERYEKLAHDPRVTPIGRFLRRFSLDELPQLYNVLKGEMALVGPRPYLPTELDKVGDYIKTIVRVRPGLTGLWQVSGRAELPFQERVLLDEFYIRNWSLWLDFSIIVRTIKAVITGRGAY